MIESKRVIIRGLSSHTYGYEYVLEFMQSVSEQLDNPNLFTASISNRVYYLLPLYNYDGSTSDRIFLGATQSDGSSSTTTFFVRIVVKWTNGNYYVIGDYTTGTDYKNINSGAYSIFSNSTLNRTMYFCLTIFPTPDGYCIGGLYDSNASTKESTAVNGVSTFNNYILKCWDNSNNVSSAVIPLHGTNNLYFKIYAPNILSAVQSINIYTENGVTGGTTGQYDELDVVRIFGKVNFDTFV